MDYTLYMRYYVICVVVLDMKVHTGNTIMSFVSLYF